MQNPFAGSATRLIRVVLLTLILLPLFARAQNFQIIWTMDGNLSGTSSSPNFTPSDASLTGAHPHSLAAILYYAIGGGNYAYGTTYWHTTGVEKYLSFSFSVSTYEYNINSVSYRVRRSDSGPTNVRLRSSLDGFSSDLSSFTLSSDATFYQVNVPIGLSGLTNGITFRLYSDNVSSYQGTFYFDQIIINGTVSSIVLPVNLTYFKIKTAGKSVQLDWETASEQNSKEFVIERSYDLITFEAIGTITATGQSSERIHYSFQDDSPLTGINYYRIKMVDMDGRFNYSNTLDAVIGATKSTFVTSPNPASSSMIRIRTDTENPEEISLTSISGSDIPIGVITHQGNFMELFPKQSLCSGLYVLSLKLNGIWQRQKVVVP